MCGIQAITAILLGEDKHLHLTRTDEGEETKQKGGGWKDFGRHERFFLKGLNNQTHKRERLVG